MCHSTKRKIADCVKGLAKRKDIRKITIQDIMDATGMSRQSFYYHFKDIYDVLEWIGKNDFASQIVRKPEMSLEDWVIQLLEVIRRERRFVEMMLREVPWPTMVAYIREPIEEQIQKWFIEVKQEKGTLYASEVDFSIDMLTTSFCYYLLDFVYKRKDISNEEMLGNLHFMMGMLEGSALADAREYKGKKLA